MAKNTRSTRKAKSAALQALKTIQKTSPKRGVKVNKKVDLKVNVRAQSSETVVTVESVEPVAIEETNDIAEVTKSIVQSDTAKIIAPSESTEITVATETADITIPLETEALIPLVDSTEQVTTIITTDIETTESSATAERIPLAESTESSGTNETTDTAEIPESTVPSDSVTFVQTVPLVLSTKLNEIGIQTETVGIGEPARKKVKLTENMKMFINNILKSDKNLQAILSDEYDKPMTFTKVYVGQVRYDNEFSKIITTLNKRIPLKNLGHLKRACRKEVLLFPITHLNLQNHATVHYYIEEKLNEFRDSFEYFKIIDVPAVAPKIRKQYVECGRAWSCNFHPDKYLEQLYNGEIFSLAELEDHRFFMAMTFEVARFYLSKDKPNIEPADILEAELNATIVVDPSNQAVVAAAFDNRANHPIQHSTMIAIDNVARTQTGGVWHATADIFTQSLKGIGSMELLQHLKKTYPNVAFGSKEYFSKSKIEELKLSASDCPYLCTDYNVYMIREPCMMCAMALVHARAKRVFFYKKHEMGVLCSKTRLHTAPGLNHRYEVFTDFV